MSRNMQWRISFAVKDILDENIAYKPGVDCTDSHRLHELTRIRTDIPFSSCLCLPEMAQRNIRTPVT